MYEALSWAKSLGLTAIPLSVPVHGDNRSGKKPLHSDWTTRTFADTDFSANGNVGIRTGGTLPGEGFLLVVDVDRKEGHANWLGLLEDEGDLPSTLQVESGSGDGYHIYLKTTKPFGCAPLPGVTKVDIKGLGGQVVAPGCVHHSGGKYRVTSDALIAWAPLWLEALLAGPSAGPSARLSLSDIAEQERVVLSPELFQFFLKRSPGHLVAPYLTKILSGQPLSSPGNRHQDIRLGFIKLLCAAFGPNIDFESLCLALHADYPEGMNADDRERTRDALVSAAKKTDPGEALALRTAGSMFEALRADEAQARTFARENIAELMEPTDLLSAALEAVRLGMSVDNKGRIKSAPENRQMILRMFYGPRMRLNTRGDRMEVRDCPGARTGAWVPFSEYSVGAWQEHLATVWGVSSGKREIFTDVKHQCYNNPVDPVRDYLDGLRWDGTPRVSTFLARALNTESPLADAYARCFFVGAVARTYAPGCKLDTQLILSGPQGAGKSTFFRALCADEAWFSDKQPYQGETQRDLVGQLHACWIWEDSEMVTSVKDEAHKKAFLSTQVDMLRKAYAYEPVELARKFVCAGSTNIDTILQDPTGARRYHILSIGKIDLGLVRAERDQIWAEAKSLYKSGGLPYLHEQEQELSNTVNQSTYRAATQGELDADMIEAFMSEPRTAGIVAQGEVFGLNKIHPAQYAEDNTIWIISRVQLAAALSLKAHAMNQATSRLLERGWKKQEQKKVKGHKFRSVLIRPSY